MDNERWVLYPWFQEHGASLIHPEDLERLEQLGPYGTVWKRLGTDGEYTVLTARHQTVRVRPDLIVEVPALAFDYGQEVRLIAKDLTGVVEEIGWHHKHSRPFYLLSIGGKRHSRRYWDDELQPVGA
jgi:hypothetical protein